MQMTMNNDRFWDLLESFHPKAEGFCRKLAGNRDDGDDLYQDSLLHAMHKFSGLRDEKAFRPWLYRLIINRYRNRVRKPWWRRRETLGAGTPEGGADDPAGRYDSRRWLERGLKALSPEERALIVLFELQQWTVAELAELHGRPPGTIKARLSRARLKMRRALERYLVHQEQTNLSREGAYGLPESETAVE
ncbi:MAG: RNA polymerase sigma factor [Candidatus Zixiibacteriota bacterium]|nr:MAG: RNA polymerase sigma factor [candidate division Zixibacteria bacterium]